MNHVLSAMGHQGLIYIKIPDQAALAGIFERTPISKWALKREASCEGDHMQLVSAEDTKNLANLAESIANTAKYPWSKCPVGGYSGLTPVPY